MSTLFWSLAPSLSPASGCAAKSGAASEGCSEGGSTTDALVLYHHDTFDRLGFAGAFNNRDAAVTVEVDIVEETLYFSDISDRELSVMLETPLTLSGNLEMRQNVVIYDGGHDITVGAQLTNATTFAPSLGFFGGALERSGGTLEVGSVNLGRSTNGLHLRPGDTVHGTLTLNEVNNTCP